MQVVFGCIEVFWVGLEVYLCIGVFLVDVVDYFQWGGVVVVVECDVVFVVIVFDVYFYQGGQCVDYVDVNVVQVVGEGVVFVVEFVVGMQLGQDQFDVGDFFFWMDVYGYVVVVIVDFVVVVFEQGDFDCVGMVSQCFVNGIVDDFLCQVVWVCGVGIYVWVVFDWVQVGQDFNIGGVIVGVYLFL